MPLSRAPPVLLRLSQGEVSSSPVAVRGNLIPRAGCYLTSVPDCFRALHIEEVDARNAQFGTDGMCLAEVVSRPMPRRLDLSCGRRLECVDSNRGRRVVAGSSGSSRGSCYGGHSIASLQLTARG
jgi:D-serine deaminase-like pyridoxal phosphate-dependent protein